MIQYGFACMTAVTSTECHYFIKPGFGLCDFSLQGIGFIVDFFQVGPVLSA